MGGCGDWFTVDFDMLAALRRVSAFILHDRVRGDLPDEPTLHHALLAIENLCQVFFELDAVASGD